MIDFFNYVESEEFCFSQKALSILDAKIDRIYEVEEEWSNKQILNNSLMCDRAEMLLTLNHRMPDNFVDPHDEALLCYLILMGYYNDEKFINLCKLISRNYPNYKFSVLYCDRVLLRKLTDLIREKDRLLS